MNEEGSGVTGEVTGDCCERRVAELWTITSDVLLGEGRGVWGEKDLFIMSSKDCWDEGEPNGSKSRELDVDGYEVGLGGKPK